MAYAYLVGGAGDEVTFEGISKASRASGCAPGC